MTLHDILGQIDAAFGQQTDVRTNEEANRVTEIEIKTDARVLDKVYDFVTKRRDDWGIISPVEQTRVDEGWVTYFTVRLT